MTKAFAEKYNRDAGCDWYVAQWMPWAGGPAWERPNAITKELALRIQRAEIRPTRTAQGDWCTLHMNYWPRLPETVRGANR